MFSLEVLRARKGDCLLLHYGSANDPHLILIDGGPDRVYGPILKPRLKQIRNTRGLAADQPLPVDVLMVSHVDDDHINGVLDLTKELREAISGNKQPLVQIFSLWHNSFENTIDDDLNEVTSALQNTFGAASVEGPLPVDIDLEADDKTLHRKDIQANLKVLASIKQGAQLLADARRLNIGVNVEFDNELILADKQAIDMGDGLHMTVIGPLPAELDALREDHQKWLKKLEKEGKTPEEVLAAFVDKSVPNLSSLVVLAEVGGKTILLTGDARGDKIIEGLKTVKLLGNNDTLHVDVLKGPHHGSAHNVAPVFFETITADHYIFSGNGENGNPERETFEMLLDARGNDDYTIHLTYPLDELDVERKKDWEKIQNKKKAQDRIPWSPAKHGLVSFFDSHPNFKKKLSIVKEDTPHLIDLQNTSGSGSTRKKTTKKKTTKKSSKKKSAPKKKSGKKKSGAKKSTKKKKKSSPKKKTAKKKAATKKTGKKKSARKKKKPAKKK